MLAMSSKVVGIHQPNFFPWLGFFQKIVWSDAFIILDDVQFPKTGGTWTNRVKLLIAGEAKWATASIVRSATGLHLIRDMHYDDRAPWRVKMVKSIEASYRKAPHFPEVMEFLNPLILNEEPSVAEYNMRGIVSICEKLGIDTSKIRMASETPSQGSSNELLISLVKAVEGSVYLCGAGALAYQDDAMFEAEGIRVEHLKFRHPEYPQHGQKKEFAAGLSIVDALMNVGFEGARSLIVPFRSLTRAESPGEAA